MKMDYTSLNQPVWRLIDQTDVVPDFNALDSFAIDDTLCQSVGSEQSPPVARLWVHDDTVVLGTQDSRLPGIVAGVDYLVTNGYQVIVRNSGGLAVPLDEEVLNISLILPVDSVFSEIDLGYETMQKLVEAMLQPYERKVEAREITGSYCPGRYDLSIGGRKFAGISQRRTKGGMAVQLFLLASGSGRERAEVIKQFYRLASTRDGTGVMSLCVNPETMASLSELLEADVTVSTLKQRLADVLQRRSDRLVTTDLSPDEVASFHHNRQRMIERNEKNLGKFDKL